MTNSFTQFGVPAIDPSSVERLAATRSPRLLIVRAGAIGDTLMVTPLVRALRRTFPGALLVFLCSKKAHDVLRYNPRLDEAIPLAYRNLPTWISAEKMRALGHLRRLRLDCALVLESEARFVELAERAGVSRIISYGKLPGADRVEVVPFDVRRHSIENHLRAAQPLGEEPDGHEMEIFYPSSLDDELRLRLEGAGIGERDLVVGVHAGWGGRRQDLNQTRLRSWPPDRFGETIRWLVKEAGARVVLTGSAEDYALNEYLCRLSATPCVNLAGQLSVLETAALIRRLNLYVTVDSGPAHMAAALGTPLVTLWGPGIFEQTAPLAGRGPVRILYHRVACAPCYGTPLMKTCRDNICMKEITIGEVREAIRDMLLPAPV